MREGIVRPKVRWRAPRKIALFWMLMIGTVFLPAEFVSVLYAGLIGFAVLQGRLSRHDQGLAAVIPFAALILIGLPGALNYPIRDVFKDVWRFALPILSLLAGWVLAFGWDQGKLQKELARFGTCMSGLVLMKAGWLAVLGEVSFTDKYRWRMALGPGELVSVWGFFAAMSMLMQVKQVGGWDWALRGAMVVNLAAILVSDSRTALVFLLAGLLLVFIPARLGRKRGIYWIVLATGMALATIVLLAGKGDPSTTLGRLQNIFWEQFSFTFSDSFDVNSKYRAFEALAALNAYLAGNWWTMLVGYGFGKLVDLGQLMVLGAAGEQSEFQHIPILHNGYLYLLIKTGFVGLLVYLLNLLRIYWNFFRVRLKNQFGFWRLIGLSITISTFLGTMVVTGPYNKGDFFTTFLVFGMALRCCFPTTLRPKPTRGLREPGTVVVPP